MMTASGQCRHGRPAFHERSDRSVSSLYMKNDSSNPPSCSHRSCATSRKHPVMTPTLRTVSRRHAPMSSGLNKLELRKADASPMPAQNMLQSDGCPKHDVLFKVPSA